MRKEQTVLCTEMQGIMEADAKYTNVIEQAFAFFDIEQSHGIKSLAQQQLYCGGLYK